MRGFGGRVDVSPYHLAIGLTSFVVLLFSLSFHEAAHAWMARRLGDETAHHEGRITLNPIAHIDPIGTVLIPVIQIFFSGIPLIGWAKPTPYNPGNFKREVSMARGHVLVAGAGPISNLVLAVVFTAVMFVAVKTGLIESMGNAGDMLLRIGIQMNVALAIFNLFPLPPLDGSKVASWGLPRSLGERYDRTFEPFGPYLLLLLVMTGVLGFVLRPIVSVVLAVINWLIF
jgi:Zn-dependent protease